MNIVKPSIDGAISFIAKGIKQLDAVIGANGTLAQKARDTIAKANADMTAAQVEIERGNRAKKKLEELVA